MKTCSSLLPLLLSTLLLFALRAGAVDPWTKVVGNGSMPISDGFGTNGVANAGNKCVDALTSFRGVLYAAVGQGGTGSGNLPSIWRTSDLMTWTNVTSSGFSGNDGCIESDTNVLFLGTGYNAAFNRGMMWRSTNGLQWTFFNGTGNGYNPTNNFAEVLGIQGGSIYSATANQKGGQVWKRPTDGSAAWTKVLDFYSGFGTADGPQTNLSSTCLYCPPSATNVMFYGTLGTTNCALYESSDGGTSWQRNAAAASAFGANNGEIAAIVEFNSFLYASTTNAQGGNLWRTPVTNAIVWSSTVPWEQVVCGGFGSGSNGELHRMVAAYGRLWVCLTNQKAQVWRSRDGANWMQSSISGFAADNNVLGSHQALAAFANADGKPFMVWAGAWVSPTNLNLQAAQVWATQIAPAGSPEITSDPQSVSTNIGSSVSFNVIVAGTAPLNYQWRLNGANIVGATNATLALNDAQTGDAGVYDVIVSNAIGRVISQGASLSVALVINTNAPPAAGTCGMAYSQTLSAGCGAPPYAWVPVGGALPDGLALDSAGHISGTPGAAGTFTFTVQVTDAGGDVATGAFSIVITDPWFKVVGNSIVPLGDGFGAGGVMNTSNTMIQSLTAYNGFLYAGVETVGYRPTIWRSSDMLNWTNFPVNAPPDFHNIFDMQSNSNGIFFGTGYGGFPSGAQIWKSTNGVAWFVFSTPASGFQTNYVNPVYVSLQGNVLYAAPGSSTSCQVWRRPADGSANWTELLDFNTGFGSAEGVRTHMGISYIYCPPGATSAVFIPCGDSASSNCMLYVTADGGATWHLNAGVGNGFGDTNNGYIASVIEFKGCLYAGTGSANSSSGAQIWRAPLATATNWSATNAWQQVVGGGFGYPSTEFHRFAVAGGELWTFLFTHTNLKAKVWRSGDGINWVQSNLDDFGTDDNAWNGALGSFTGPNGTNYMLWGGEWTDPTNSGINAAQIWATQMPPDGSPVIASQPQDVSTNVGVDVSFSVGATGAPPLSYKWRMNATDISGATNATLTLNNVQANNAGGYDAIVGNSVGSVTSRVATLSIAPANQGANYGTPYVWLACYGFTDNLSAAELLIGSNGMPVWQSYVADLNPTSAGSRFAILAFTNSPDGRVCAAFDSSTGRIYELQCRTNLSVSNGWFGVSGQSNIPGNGGMKVLSDTKAATPQFYRIRVQLPK